MVLAFFGIGMKTDFFSSPVCVTLKWNEVAQSSLTLCNPVDCSLPGSSVHGILQARTQEWVAISFSNAWKWKVKVKSESEVAQSCPTVHDPMDCSLPGSPVHGIFQARVLEWGAIAFSDAIKVMLKILQARFQQYVSHELSDV